MTQAPPTPNSTPISTPTPTPTPTANPTANPAPANSGAPSAAPPTSPSSPPSSSQSSPPSSLPPLPPYAQALGIRIDRMEGDVPILAVDFGDDVEGRPEHYHGGATGGLLENAAFAALQCELIKSGREHKLKPINITVQYLNAATAQTSYAKGRVVKIGRRNANISVEAWQDNPGSPIATAILNILMAEPAKKAEAAGDT